MLQPLSSTLYSFSLRLPPNYLNAASYPIYILQVPPNAKFQFASLYDEPFTSCRPFRDKWTEWPQMTLNTKRSNVLNVNATATPSPKFHSVSLYDEPFTNYRPFEDKCTEWPQMNLKTKFMSKVTHIDVTISPESQIALFFSLYDQPFLSYSPFLTSAPNGPQMTLNTKEYPYPCYNYPWVANLTPFRSTANRFWVTGV